MNWPLWSLPIVIPFFGVIWVYSWVKHRWVRGDIHWNESRHMWDERQRRITEGWVCECRACRLTQRERGV